MRRLLDGTTLKACLTGRVTCVERRKPGPCTELRLGATWDRTQPTALCSESSSRPVLDMGRRVLPWETALAIYIPPEASRSCLSRLNSGVVQLCGADRAGGVEPSRQNWVSNGAVLVVWVPAALQVSLLLAAAGGDLLSDG